MTVHNLMAGYTAYTDAKELAAASGTHRDIFVTTTGTVPTVLMPPGDRCVDGSVDAADAPVLTVVRQAPANVTATLSTSQPGEAPELHDLRRRAGL